MPSLAYDLRGLEEAVQEVDTFAQKLAPVMVAQLQIIRDTWLSAVSGEQLPGMERAVNHPGYQRALREPSAVEYPVAGDAYYGRVVVRGDGGVIAERVERGSPPRDMKYGLTHGPKAKRSKKGTLYNTIPLGFKAPKPGAFRPGFMAGMFHATSPFRRVSENSPADSWIYPAIPAVHVIAAVRTAVEPQVMEALQKVMEEWR